MEYSAWGWDFAVMRRKKSSAPTAVAPGVLQLERRSEKTEAPELSPVEVANVIKVTLKLSESFADSDNCKGFYHGGSSLRQRLERPALRDEFRESPPVQVASASNPNRYPLVVKPGDRCILPPTLPEDLPAVVLEEFLALQDCGRAWSCPERDGEPHVLGAMVHELAMFGRIRMLQFCFAVFAKPGEYSY
ncbi:unnamed protein product [Cladocopium goreaui]|uniref:Uncharacterized protein n=1 Tax=Cladocopium goreaui TaxID=2562237 RepID=A0A9P1DLL5_9DINO|nr:unnamed protein product [Cladocopium goreaui]